MKKFNRVLASLGAMAMLAWGGVFTSCGNDDDDPEPSFTSQVKVVSVDELGASASGASSSDEEIAKAEVADGAVKITSVKEGTATVTATASGYTNATIPVTVANNGAITVGSVTKFVAEKTEESTALNGVTISGSESVQYNSADVKYTATADVTGSPEVTYAWAVTADDGVVTAKSGEATAELTLSFNNADTANAKTVTVKVTATYGETKQEATKTVTVSAHGVEVKDEVTGVTISGTGLADNAVSIAADGTIALTATATSTGNPTLTYAWEVTDADGVIASKTGEATASLTLTANNASLTAKTVSVKVRVSDGTNSKDATVSVTVGGKEGVKTTWDFSKSDATGTGASAWNGVPKPASQGSALVTRAENSYVGYLGRKLWLVDGVYAEYRSGGLGYTNSAKDATHTSTDFVKAIESEAITGPFTLYVTANTANDARTFKIFVGTDKATLWADDNVKVSEKLAKKTYEVSYSGEDAVYIGIGTLPSESDKTVYTSITKIELSAAAEIPADKFKATDFAVKFADEAISFTENAATLNKSPADNGSAFAVEIAPAYATGASVAFDYTATTGSDVSVTKVADKNEATLTIADGISADNAGALKITVTDDSGTSLEKTIALTISATVSDADKVAAAKADITTALLGEDSTFDYVGTSVAAANATEVINAATIRYKGEVGISYNTPSAAEPNLVVTVTLNEASDTVTYDFAEKYGVTKQITAAVKLVKALEAYTWATDASTTASAITNADKAAITKYDVTVTAAAGTNKVTTTVQSTITNTEKKELVLSPYYTELFDEETKEGDDYIYASGVKSNCDAATASTVADGSGYTPTHAVKIANNIEKYISVPVYGNCDIVLVHVADGTGDRGVKASVDTGSGNITAISASAFAYGADFDGTDTVAVKTADDGKSAYASVNNDKIKVSSVLTFAYTGGAGTIKLQNTKADMTTKGAGGIYIYAIDVKKTPDIRFKASSFDIGNSNKATEISQLLTKSSDDLAVTYALKSNVDGVSVDENTGAVTVATAVEVGTIAKVVATATASGDTAELTINVVEYVAVDSVSLKDGDSAVMALTIAQGGSKDLSAYLKVIAAEEGKTPTNTTVTWSGSANGVTVDSTGKVSVADTATVGATATITVTSSDDNTKSASVTITVGNKPSVEPFTEYFDTLAITKGGEQKEISEIELKASTTYYTANGITWNSGKSGYQLSKNTDAYGTGTDAITAKAKLKYDKSKTRENSIYIPVKGNCKIIIAYTGIKEDRSMRLTASLDTATLSTSDTVLTMSPSTAAKQICAVATADVSSQKNVITFNYVGGEGTVLLENYKSLTDEGGGVWYIGAIKIAEP